MSKKTKKSKDLSRCCKKCKFYDARNKEDPICSISAESVNEDHVCKNFNSEIVVKCQRCGAEMTYTDKNSYYMDIVRFSMTSGGGGAGQNLHFCLKCIARAQSLFDDFLEKVRSKTDD